MTRAARPLGFRGKPRDSLRRQLLKARGADVHSPAALPTSYCPGTLHLQRREREGAPWSPRAGAAAARPCVGEKVPSRGGRAQLQPAAAGPRRRSGRQESAGDRTEEGGQTPGKAGPVSRPPGGISAMNFNCLSIMMGILPLSCIWMVAPVWAP